MRRITHLLVATVAASALVASTATARVDRYDSPTSSLAGTVEHQDLRGEHAQDAARLAAEDAARVAAAAQIARGEQTRHASFLRRRAAQDLRGEQAQEAARLAALPQDLRGEHARDAARLADIPPTGRPPVYWSYTYEAPKPSPHTVSAPAPKPDDTDLWLILAIALGATGVVAGSAFAATRRSRVPA
jgi:hypothetical protein